MAQRGAVQHMQHGCCWQVLVPVGQEQLHHVPLGPRRAPENVCGAGCAGLLPKQVCCFFDWGNISFGCLGSWESWESSSRESSESCCCWAECACRQSVQGVSLEEPCYFAQVGTTPYPWWSEGSPAAAAAAAAGQQQQQQRSTARIECARTVVPSRRRRSAHREEGLENAVLHVQYQLVNSAVKWCRWSWRSMLTIGTWQQEMQLRNVRHREAATCRRRRLAPSRPRTP
jgi:hypothetical protein